MHTEDIIELSSETEDEEDDDCVMVPSAEEEEEEAEAEDVNNGGSHINDDFNCPDDKGRVLVNVGHPPEDPDIFLSARVAKAIKPHQVCIFCKAVKPCQVVCFVRLSNLVRLYIL